MTLSIGDLEALKVIGITYANEFLRVRNLEDGYKLLAVFLYGGAAKFHFGLKPTFRDFDINVTFRMSRNDDRRREIPTQARPKDLEPYKAKIVQVTRNVYAGKEHDAVDALKELARLKHTRRWQTIRSTPLILLYPEIREIRLP
jgi:hypothetical protein